MGYSSLSDRLESWRRVERSGRPAWLAEHAPGAIAELEAEIAREEHRRQLAPNQQGDN